MSLEALRWAFGCEVQRSAERLVLLALANDCRRGGALAFPSRERLHEVTKLDPKTITAALKTLESAGLITSTGERRGLTGRIAVYRLKVERLPAPNDAENGTISEPHKSGKRHRIGPAGETPPLFPTNDAEIPAANVTKNGAQNREVRPEPGKGTEKRRFVLPDWIPVEPWKAYVSMRRKIGHPLTRPARTRALLELEDQRAKGADVGAVIQRTVDRKWRGFFSIPAGQASKRGVFDRGLSEKFERAESPTEKAA